MKNTTDSDRSNPIAIGLRMI